MIDTFQPAGRRRRVFSLAGALNRQGKRVSLCFPKTPPGLPGRYGNFYRVPVITALRSDKMALLLEHEAYDLIHLQDPRWLNYGVSLARILGVPFGITISFLPPGLPADYLRRAAFVITPRKEIQNTLKPYHPDTVLFPEGIDLERFRPAPKTGFRLALFQEDSVTQKAALALAKAATICEISLDILGVDQASRSLGDSCAHPCCPASVLAETQIVAGRGRAMLEGMACGNAVLLLGRYYHGLLTPNRLRSFSSPGNNGVGEEPCHRTILRDLTRLQRNRVELQQLQEWGRRWVRENHDLRLVTEMTARLYSRASGKT